MNRHDPTKWTALNPIRFTDRRMRLTRDSGLVYQNVRAFRASIARKNPDTSKPEHVKCGHAHNKMSAARECARKEANRRNRAEAKS